MSKVGKVIQTDEQKSSVQICKGFFKKKDAQKNSVQNSVTVFKCDVCNYSTKYGQFRSILALKLTYSK